MKYLYIVLTMIACLTACGTATKQPALHDFGAPELTMSGQNNASINVNAPTWLWDNRIRYRLLYAKASQIGFYGFDRWIASPPELFEQLLVSSSKTMNYALTIRLQDFEQQFDTPDRAHVLLRFTVEAYSTDKKQNLGSQVFTMQLPTKTPDAAGAINGFIDLTQRAVDNIQNWLVGLH